MYGHNTKCKAGQGYLGKPADMYSIGSIVYRLIRGDKPFRDEKDSRWNDTPGQVIIERAGRLDHEQANEPHHWTDTTDIAKDFLAKLFKRDPKKRMSAGHALNHHWIANEHTLKHFDKLYSRAKTDWKPEADLVNLIERLPALAKNPWLLEKNGAESSPALVSAPKSGIPHATSRGHDLPPHTPAAGQIHPRSTQHPVCTSSPDPLGLPSSVSGLRKKLGLAPAQSRLRQVQAAEHESLSDILDVPARKGTSAHINRQTSSLSPIPERLSPPPPPVATTASTSFPPWTQNAPSQTRKQQQVQGISQAWANAADPFMVDSTPSVPQTIQTRSRKRHLDADTPATGKLKGQTAVTNSERDSIGQNHGSITQPSARAAKSLRIQPPRAAATQKNSLAVTGKLKPVRNGKRR